MTLTISYQQEPQLTSAEFIDCLRRSTLAERRPVENLEMIEGMLRHADVIVTARNESNTIIGVARSITDYHFCTYLSDLAVDEKYQRQGIGRRLIEESHRLAGIGTRLILLSAPAAQDYYPHIGMVRHDSCWQILPGEGLSKCAGYSD